VWIDTHAHLADEALVANLSDVLVRAKQAGIGRLLCVAVDAQSSQAAIQIANQNDIVGASVGIHPNYAHLAANEDWNSILAFTKHPKVCALGETGLDLHWDDCPFALQQENFARHIAVSQETGLPLIIHMRDCESEMVAFLKHHSGGVPLNGVMHSFSGSTQTAAECLSLGLHISFAGMLTYKKSQDLRETAKTIPLDRLLLETDCPYLSPEPMRSKRPNEPANLPYTGRCLAQTLGMPASELEQITWQNSCRLFWPHGPDPSSK
jgi:TatD DNase family protein